MPFKIKANPSHSCISHQIPTWSSWWMDTNLWSHIFFVTPQSVRLASAPFLGGQTWCGFRQCFATRGTASLMGCISQWPNTIWCASLIALSRLQPLMWVLWEHNDWYLLPEGDGCLPQTQSHHYTQFLMMIGWGLISVQYTLWFIGHPMATLWKGQGGQQSMPVTYWGWNKMAAIL